MNQRILIVDKDSRAHALAWKIARDRPGRELFVAPGNGGLAPLASLVPLSPADIRGIVDWCRRVRPDLVIIGPCLPLRYGIVDALTSEGIAAVGPTALGATIESSKAWAAKLGVAAGVPMPPTHAFDDADAADAFVKQQGRPYVVKPDGEAFAEAVTVSDTTSDTHAAIDRISRSWWTYGAESSRIVLQERVHGVELHVAALTDGRTHRVLGAVRGYKRPNDGDQGAFTPGMGSHSPVAEWTPGLRAEIDARIFTPLLAGLRRRGIRFTGFIEAGVMLTAYGPLALEFNCRLGDPSANVILPLLSFDLVDAMDAAIRGELEAFDIADPVGAAVCVMLRRDRPEDGRTGNVVIDGLESVEDEALVFHSKTSNENGAWLIEPGATLGVTGLGATVAEARRRAYSGVRRIHFDGAYWRTDIAKDAEEVDEPGETPLGEPISTAAATAVRSEPSRRPEANRRRARSRDVIPGA